MDAIRELNRSRLSVAQSLQHAQYAVNKTFGQGTGSHVGVSPWTNAKITVPTKKRKVLTKEQAEARQTDLDILADIKRRRREALERQKARP